MDRGPKSGFRDPGNQKVGITCFRDDQTPGPLTSRLSGPEESIMKMATAYERKNNIFLHADSKTATGLWVAAPPYLKVSSQDDCSRLGEAVLEVLNASREGIPHPSSWDGLFDPMLSLAGVDSWRAFAEGANCIAIELEDHRLTFVPYRNLGAKNGFEPITEDSICLPTNAASHEVGQGAINGFARCPKFSR